MRQKDNKERERKRVRGEREKGVGKKVKQRE